MVAFSEMDNHLEREKLIKIYPNLQNETIINLSYTNFIFIKLDIFDNLSSLTKLYLNNNKIEVSDDSESDSDSESESDSDE